MKFHERTFAYKFGVFLCIVAIPTAILSLVFPTWKKDAFVMQGLFQTCGQLLVLSTCQTINLNSQGGWFEAVRCLQLICIILLFIDVIYIIRRNPSRYEGLDTFIIGIICSCGPALYGYYFFQTGFGGGAALSWGYILACLTPGLAVTGSVCICGSEFTPDNRVQPYSENIDTQRKRKIEKKKKYSSRDWSGFPDHGSHVEKDYYRDYYKNKDPQWDYLHRY